MGFVGVDEAVVERALGARQDGADLTGGVAYREHEVVVAGGVAVNVVGGMSGDVDANSAITRIASG